MHSAETGSTSQEKWQDYVRDALFADELLPGEVEEHFEPMVRRFLRDCALTLCAEEDVSSQWPENWQDLVRSAALILNISAGRGSFVERMLASPRALSLALLESAGPMKEFREALGQKLRASEDIERAHTALRL